MTNKIQKKKSIEIADILKAHIADYQAQYRLYPDQYKIVYDLLNCRTAYLGGHIDRCMECGNEQVLYNSCRNRHCPKCQNLPREKWMEDRRADLLPVKYFHNVFTLPHELNGIMLANKKIMLNILFKSVSETLLCFGKNPKNRLNGRLGFIAVLHTWDQLLKTHFHLHCLVPGGAVSEDRQEWLSCKNRYLFNIEALSFVFRGRFIEHLKTAYKKGMLCFSGKLVPFEKSGRFGQLINSLYGKQWVVYIKKPVERPEFIVKYLARYTHRAAISNQRIAALKDGMVTFTRKDRKTGTISKVTIPAVEFIRRFLMHALPGKFVRIRHYGFLSNRDKKQRLSHIRRIMGAPVKVVKRIKTSVRKIMLKLTGVDIQLCPYCRKGKMRQVQKIPMYTGMSAYSIIRPPDLIMTA